jgi:glycosyltransferase involved in cell wall biosynthesis
VVLPNLMDLQPFEEMPGPQDGLSLLPEGLREKPKVLFLSRLHEKKGVDVLIRAAALLRERRRECVVMVAGKGEEGYERYLHELTERLSLQDDVVFLGLVTGKTKISLYQAADLFVLPTQQENFGMVLAEALAAGTPVITTKGTDIWMEIEQAGGTIAVGTAEGIAGAIENLLSRRNEWASLGERGRAWAFESLAMEPLARKYEAFYRTVAGIG